MIYNHNGVSLNLSNKAVEKLDFVCSPEFVARAVKAYLDYVDKKDNEDIKQMLLMMMQIAFDGCDTNFKKEEK